jgi:Holliday junction resolvase RusA-like endonuclease
MELIINGKPIPLKRHKHTTRNGRIFNYDPSKADKANFLKKVQNLAPEDPLYGAVSVSLEVYLVRPKSHFGTGRNSKILKDNAPKYPIISSKENADIDNYIKFVFDALNGVFYKDDGQIVHLESIKEYSTEPKTIVRIYPYEY